jgi:hypothetical protein
LSLFLSRASGGGEQREKLVVLWGLLLPNLLASLCLKRSAGLCFFFFRVFFGGGEREGGRGRCERAKKNDSKTETTTTESKNET